MAVKLQCQDDDFYTGCVSKADIIVAFMFLVTVIECHFALSLLSSSLDASNLAGKVLSQLGTLLFCAGHTSTVMSDYSRIHTVLELKTFPTKMRKDVGIA